MKDRGKSCNKYWYSTLQNNIVQLSEWMNEWMNITYYEIVSFQLQNSYNFVFEWEKQGKISFSKNKHNTVK